MNDILERSIMPLYDMQCLSCGHQFETIANIDEIVVCPKCALECKRLISVHGPNLAIQDAEWIRSIREVVDKEGGPAAQAFLKDSTRDNLHAYMKAEGIRHFEPGEKPRKPDPPNMDKIQKEVWEKHQKRNRLEVN